ncbi:ATP-binding protein [Aliarcobacter butzleri]|uniref:ATP-binding protein n=1 Tax=Aliarcobacter butzleri TaxID=28197 RepID=UPI003AF9ADBC
MKVNIERAIKSITEHIDFYQPLYESIVNSFQAKATKVEINFELNGNYVIGYSIKDNGIGFTTANIDSFLELWSEYKIKQFALGSGRILCLKVFDNMIIESQTKNINLEDGFKVNINFTKKFRANSIQDVDSGNFEEIKRFKNNSNIQETITTFKNINKDYKIKKDSNLYDINTIQNDLLIKLLPMFINFEKESKDFEISIQNKVCFDKKNLKLKFKNMNFKDEEFSITKDLSKIDKDKNEKITFKFNLKYRIEKEKQQEIVQFYGAADRYICSFPKGTALSKLEDGYSGIFCLTSNYFNERVKDSRNAFRFTMNQSNPTPEDPITFPEINEQLTIILNKILRNTFTNIDKDLNAKKLNIIKSFPHLIRYVEKIDNLTISENDLLKNAEEAYIKETKNIRNELISFTEKIKKGKTKFDEKKYKEIRNQFTQVGIEQLADYIGYRQTIIDMLLEIYDNTKKNKSNFLEDDIHNLFMPKSNSSKSLSMYGNNVWIFDDKFMSYIYTASDLTIAQIVSDVTGKPKDEVIKHHQEQKPDLIMFYSDDKDEVNKDILLVEFKRLHYDLDGRKKAITQLQDYPMYIKKNIKNVRTIFSYTIIDFDEPFREWLTDSQGFIPNAFGNENNDISEYYRYNETVKAHLNVLSFSQVLHDANKRNKVFLDILIQNFEKQ